MTDRYPERWLNRERQFCSLCRAEGDPSVKVVDAADRAKMSPTGFVLHRRALIRRHLAEVHGR